MFNRFAALFKTFKQFKTFKTFSELADRHSVIPSKARNLVCLIGGQFGERRL